MHGKERLILWLLSFFGLFLFGCNQRDVVVNITPVSSALHSEDAASGNTQPSSSSEKTVSEATSSSARTKSILQSSGNNQDDIQDKAELEAELDSLNIFYQQYKKDYQYNLNQKKNEIAELQKEIREKESERDQKQEDLERYLLSGDDGLEQLEAELRIAILKMDAAIADLQQQLDWLTEEKKQLEDDFAVAEQNYLTYKGYLQTQLKSLK